LYAQSAQAWLLYGLQIRTIHALLDRLPADIFDQLKMTDPTAPLLTLEACDLAIRQRTMLMGVVSREYFSLMAREYDAIRPHLPRTISRLLDIGSGLGGLHVHTLRDFGNQVEVNLLDHDRSDGKMRYGFREKTEAYNSFLQSRTYFERAGIPADDIKYWDADSASDLERLQQHEGQFDAIISLKSWCFHYPAETYLHLVEKLLAKDGALIVDVRRDSGVKAVLTRQFDLANVAAQDKKSERLCLRRRCA
jgi:SAM-dependent methyltransferase